MHRVLIVFFALILTFQAAPSAQASELTQKIQSTYENIESFSADFMQQLRNAASGEVETRQGRFFFKQPSLVRWATVTPEEELLIVGKEAVWDYFPEEETAIKYPLEEVLSSKTMIRFISGKANLDEDFVVEEQGEEAGLTKLKLTPKEPEPGLVLAYLWVDPQSSMVVSVLLIDFYGNGNKLGLDNVVINPELPDELFEFAPPQGVDVQDNTTPLAIPAPQ